jgi:pyrroloquinoline quinone biosynthesis protein D
VRLNPTAAEVLALCDGKRSLDAIVAALAERYSGADVGEDVRSLVDAMAQKGLVVDAAA